MTLAISDPSIETDRLLLRRITTSDFPFYERIHADPDVARYIGYGRPRSSDETRIWLDRIIECYETFQLGQLAVVRKSDGALIGRCGIAYFAVDDRPADGGEPRGYFVPGEAPDGVTTSLEPELGYTFDRAAWGQGFAREAARAVFAYSTTIRRGDRIVSVIHPDNVRSRRLAESFGATLVDRVRAFDTLLDRLAWPATKTATGSERSPSPKLQ
jgi:[ribosomal protein S5]-alanine N-acetyltransferase